MHWCLQLQVRRRAELFPTSLESIQMKEKRRRSTLAYLYTPTVNLRSFTNVKLIVFMHSRRSLKYTIQHRALSL